MTIEVDITGNRYLENRDTTAVLSGQPVRGDELHRALDPGADGDERQPWRIATVGSPLARS